jgi:hypothetical protein
LAKEDQQIAKLQADLQAAKNDQDKKRIEEQLNQAQGERKKTIEHKTRAEKVKHDLSFGDFLLALGELVWGVVEGVSCIEDGDSDACIQAGVAIAAGANKLAKGGKEVEETVPYTQEVDTPVDPSTVSKENGVRDAAAKPLQNQDAPAAFAKANPNLDVVPGDKDSGLFVAQSLSGGVVKEVDLVDGATNVVALVITDDNLLASTENKGLATLAKFKRFDKAVTRVSDDKKVILVEIRGQRSDGTIGAVLLRVYPLHPSGKIVAVGE